MSTLHTTIYTLVRTALLWAFLALFGMLPALPSFSLDIAHAAPAGNGGPALERPVALEVSVGKSVILHTEREVTRISLASPETAEVMVISPKQIYVSGKTTGSTTLTLWGKDDRIFRVYDVVITADLTELKRLIHQVLPNEPEVQVLATGDSVTLTGTVSSSSNLATALALAETYAPEKVNNLLQVGGVHQVMLEVRIAEMNRSVTRRLGFNWRINDGENIQYGLLNSLTGLSSTGITSLGQNITGVFTKGLGTMTIDMFLDALKTNGLVKILAEPNLVCLSGETANFLAGGEIPVPIPSGLGTLAIEYKPFGVWLEFTPTVLGNGTVNLVVSPEVSELDPDNGVVLDSITIPALTTRRASTTIELKDGQTYAIAGLMKDNVRENIHKYPALGDIPVLGTLFRSSDYLSEQSELVILVTPRMAKPLNVAEQTLPTDGFKNPNEIEFFLFGQTEGGMFESSSSNTAAVPPVQDDSAGFDGEFGQSLSE